MLFCNSYEICVNRIDILQLLCVIILILTWCHKYLSTELHHLSLLLREMEQEHLFTQWISFFLLMVFFSSSFLAFITQANVWVICPCPLSCIITNLFFLLLSYYQFLPIYWLKKKAKFSYFSLEIMTLCVKNK